LAAALSGAPNRVVQAEIVNNPQTLRRSCSLPRRVL